MTLSGNITSTQTDRVFEDPDTFAWTSIPAIAYVQATRSITGDIVASPVADVTGNIFRWDSASPILTRATWSSIGRVVITGTTPADILTGDVLAAFGHVERVVAGAIGTETDTVAIHGGVRIGQIVTTSTAPAFLDIDAGTRGKDDLLIANALKNLQDFNTERPTSIQVVDIKGDLTGTIQLFDVLGDLAQSAEPEEYYQSNHQGIFVGGDFVGDITVEYDYENADMIARSFQGDIKIGQMLQGAVVAVGTDGSTDPLDGTIGSIEVGLPLHPYADGPNPNDEGGFQGTFKTTLDAPMNGPGVREIWYGGAPGYETERAKDSVIRAYTSIGSVRITKMSNGLVRTSGNSSQLRPRVEAPYVSSIVIDEMESGSIWSGTLIEFPANPFDNITDNYASVGVLSIGCVGPAADLWLQGTALIEVTSELAGEIHVPSLASGQTIRIGEQFLDVAGIESPFDPLSVPCGRFDGGLYIGQVFGYDHRALRYVGDGGPSNEEPTPRSVWEATFTDSVGGIFGYPLEPTPEFPNPPFAVETNTLPFDGVNRGVASYGRILIREPNGLHGQIIIDANNTGPQRAGTHWLGDVEIGTGESPDIGDPNISVTPEVISTDEIRATTIGSGDGEGPLYTALPSSFGNGAVGLVPFALHDKATTPDNPAVGDEVPGVILESIFLGSFPDPSRPDRIRLEFYGPILSIGTEDPVSIRYPDGLGGTVDANALDWFDFRIVNAPNTSSPRVLEIFAGSGASNPMPLSVFTVTPNPNLLCDLGPGIAPVAVAPFTYRFKLLADCPSVDGAPNGIPDADEIDASRDPFTGISPLDDGFDDQGNQLGLRNNGIIDECDRTCSPCAADYDANGGVDGADLAAFFFDFEQGLTCADIDENGGVDGGDIGAFFAVFEAGGCD